MHQRLTAQAQGSKQLEAILSSHPLVDLVEFRLAEENKTSFSQAGWNRKVLQAAPSEALYGIPELMDNNPLVCADSASVPGPAATLALVAAGPLARAELMVEQPAMVFSFEDDFSEIEPALCTEGWRTGANVAANPIELDGCVNVGCLAQIRTTSMEDLNALYDECYGRSFFVRRFETGHWEIALAKGAPWAYYRLQLSPSDEDTCVLRIDVLADLQGKCGAAQQIHCMNIMAGFEEDLGLHS